MNLRWRAFERTARRRVRTELKASPPLWKDHRRRSLLRRHFNTPAWVGRLVIAGVLLFWIALRTHSIAAVSAVIVLSTMATILFRADQLVRELYLSPRLHVFSHLPIPDDAIFEVQTRRFFRISLWSALDFTALYAVLLSKMGGSWIAAAMLLGTVHCLIVTAAAVCLHGLAPGRHFSRLALLSMAVVLGMLIFDSRQVALADWVNRFAGWVPPVGWLRYALGLSDSSSLFQNLGSSGVTTLVLGLAPLVYRSSRRNYSLREAIFSLARKLSGSLNPGEPIAPRLAAGFQTAPAEMEAVIKTRAFLSGLDWKQIGPFERLLSLLLSPRERLLVEFTLAGNPGLSRSFRNSILLIIIGGVGVFLLFPGFKADAGMLPFLLVVLLPGTGQWRGFLVVRVGGVAQSAAYAVYPVGFWELARVVLKVSLFRLFLWIPLVLGAVSVLDRTSWLQTAMAESPLLKLIALSIIAQPILTLMQFSPGTNDGNQPVVIVFAALVAFAFAACIITFFVSTRPQVVLAALLAGTLCSVLCLLVYGRFFNRNQFDLVPTQKE